MTSRETLIRYQQLAQQKQKNQKLTEKSRALGIEAEELV